MTGRQTLIICLFSPETYKILITMLVITDCNVAAMSAERPQRPVRELVAWKSPQKYEHFKKKLEFLATTSKLRFRRSYKNKQTSLYVREVLALSFSLTINDKNTKTYIYLRHSHAHKKIVLFKFFKMVLKIILLPLLSIAFEPN